MTDQELLDLSAKAAGYKYAKNGGYIVVDGIPGNWNPLSDDGDALRLAVKLHIGVRTHGPDHWLQKNVAVALWDAGAQPAPSVPDTYAAGINAVAAMLQSKADEYAKEHGHDDMGGLSFGPGMGGQIKMDYYTNLIELTDDVRAMLAAAPEAKP